MKKILLIILFCLFIFPSCFNLFDSEEKLVASISLNNQVTFDAYYVTTGATTEDVVQIRRKQNGRISIIKAYEGFSSATLSIIKYNLIVNLIDANSSLKKADTLQIDSSR